MRLIFITIYLLDVITGKTEENDERNIHETLHKRHELSDKKGARKQCKITNPVHANYSIYFHTKFNKIKNSIQQFKINQFLTLRLPRKRIDR